MAFKAPSGLMGRPEEPERFSEFDLEENGEVYGKLYIAPEVLERVDPHSNELVFYVQDYGRFRLKVYSNAV